MSRKPSSSSKYKISAPQPMPQSGLDNYGADNGPYPSFAPRQPTAAPNVQASRPSEYDASRSYSSARVPSSSVRTEPPPSAGPMRPARSRMRDAPDTSPGRPARAPRPLLTADTRIPSGTSSIRQGGHSPISPVSPEKPAPTKFNDPFAMDRSQRSELRDQYKMSERQASTPMTGSSSGTDKLRNVVGAFMAAGKQTEQPARRPGKGDARQKVTRHDESWDMKADGGKFGELDTVMRTIRNDWPFVTGSDFSASTLALSLLSPQSTSLPPHPSLSSFSKLHDSLSAALQSSVQAHFQSFAASLPAHAQFLTTLSRAQDQVRLSKSALKEARDGFGGKGKSELAGVRARERTVRHMLKILDIIDQLKQVPDQLEALIGDKKFLPAALILVRSVKTINKPEISQIGAVSELKAYLQSQESILTDILVEELQSHLYLKNYYSDSRWRAYVPNQQSLPSIAPEDGSNRSDPSEPIRSPTMSPDPSNAVAGPGPSSRFSRYLSSLAVRPAPDQMIDQLGSDLSTLPSQASIGSIGPDSQHDASGDTESGEAQNPEADSYRYIEAVLEALFVLGKLTGALETVAQRVSTEIHHLIETTLDEVEERSEQRREEEAFGRPDEVALSTAPMTEKGARRQSIFTPSDTLRIAVSLDAMGPPRHAAILKDLFWTLYSKLAAVLEGHRVIYEVARWIPSRRDPNDTAGPKGYSAPTIPVLEVWKPVQQEVRNLLYMYLADDSQGSVLDRHQILSVNEVLRDSRTTRDRQRQMFRFADTDARQLASEIKPVDEALQKSLKSSVPGLVSMQSADTGANSQQSILPGYTSGSDDRFTSSTKHRTLIPPNAFNVSTLFQPTLAFIERATSIVPPGFEEETGTFSSVLEDFVVKVFLPQLDEKVTASFQQAVSGYDAFQLDRGMPFTDRPPLKSSVRVMTLIHSLCVMLQTTPFHKENYSRLIIGVIVQYYQQCSARFKELVSLPVPTGTLGDPALALPAAWAQREDLIDMLTEMRSVMPADRSEVAIIASREIELEQKLLGSKAVIETQLVNSQRKLEALGQLCESMRWFIDALLDLQSTAEEPTSPGDGPDPHAPPMRPMTTAHDGSDPPRLPLTRAMKQRYDAIIQTYEQLAEMVLNTMRLEIRCRVMCNLGHMMQKGDFRPESEALEPDADIVDLTTVLLESEEVASRTIVAEDRDFLFRGMSHLVDHMFVSSARALKVINAAGVAKIHRNMLALQQTMRSINQSPADGVLHLSSVYWDMYNQDPKDILENLRNSTKPPFSFEDYNTMLNLICKTNMSEAASSDLNTYLIDLHALAMSIDGWEM